MLICFETEIIKSYFRLYCQSHAPAFMSGTMVLVVARQRLPLSWGRDKFRAVDPDPVFAIAKTPTSIALLR